MSSEVIILPTYYTMKLDFDVDQVSTALRFNLLQNTGSDPTSIQPDGSAAMQTSGYAAGGYNLLQYDGINILICASCESETEPEININGLTLVALPAPYGTTVSSTTSNSLRTSNTGSVDEPPASSTIPPLSPYDADFATCHFDVWMPYESGDSDRSGHERRGDLADTDTAPWRRYQTSKSFGGASSSVGEILDSSPEPTSNLTIIAVSGLWQIMGFLSVTITTGEVAKHRVYTFDPDLMVGSGAGPTHQLDMAK